MDAEVRKKARPFDGAVPDSWEFLGMSENRVNRFRYYRDLDGAYYFTAQRLKRKREPKIDVREKAGYTFAKRRFHKKMYEVW